MSNVRLIIFAASVVALTSGFFVWRARWDKSAAPGKVRMPSAVASRAVTSKSATTMLRKLMEGGEIPKLTPEQLRASVEKQKHGAASLLAAWQLGGDKAWLDEAVGRFPNNPRVALAMLGTFSELNGDAKEWIERLKQSDPGNSVGWCYDALSEFKNGSPEAARAALAEAAKLGRFDGYSKEAAGALAEAYRNAGVEALVAEVAGGFSVPLPQLSIGMQLSKEAIAKLGPDMDAGTIDNILALSNSVRSGGGIRYLISDLVSSAIERKILDQISLLELVPGTKKFVMERLVELDAEKQTIKDLVAKASPLLPELNDSELKQYFRRVQVDGELKAMQWVLARHPEVR